MKAIGALMVIGGLALALASTNNPAALLFFGIVAIVGAILVTRSPAIPPPIPKTPAEPLIRMTPDELNAARKAEAKRTVRIAIGLAVVGGLVALVAYFRP